MVGLLVIGLAGGATGLGAQEPAGLTGRVTDASTGEPVPSAMLAVTGAGIQTLTAPDGSYRIRGLVAGRYSVEVRAIGYAVKRQEVAIASGGAGSLDFALAAEPIAIDGVGAEVDRRRTDPRMAGFWRRLERAQGLGHFFTRDEIEQRGARRLSDMFVGMPGVRIVENDQRNGRYVSFGRTYLIGDNARADCPAMLYVDGIPMAIGEFGVDLIHLDQVEGIEVYAGSSRVPAEFNRTSATEAPAASRSDAIPMNYRGDARCGVVAVWSRTTMRPRR